MMASDGRDRDEQGSGADTGPEIGPESVSGADAPFDDDRVDTDEALAGDPVRLQLGDDDVRLPWLEGADDASEDAGSGAGELLRFAVLGLLVLALIVGGIWWLTRKPADDATLADGSTIEAPDAPYKQRPEDPEGKTFEGTGDTSFAVSEGQDRPVRLGAGEGSPSATASGNASPAAAPVPSPGFSSVPRPGASMASSSGASGAQAGGVGVQVGAYSTRALAEAGWSKLVQRSDALAGVSHRIVEGRADIGTVYRLQAVAGDPAGARALCGRLKAAGIACQVKN